MEIKQSECWPPRLASTTSAHPPNKSHPNSLPPQLPPSCQQEWQMAMRPGPPCPRRTPSHPRIQAFTTFLPPMQIAPCPLLRRHSRLRRRDCPRDLRPRRLVTVDRRRALCLLGLATLASNRLSRLKQRRRRDLRLPGSGLRRELLVLRLRCRQGFSKQGLVGGGSKRCGWARVEGFIGLFIGWII